MDVRLVLLMNCVALVYCQNTISARNEAEWENEYFEDLRYEIESIRQLLMTQVTQQKAAVCNDEQAIQEMKSKIQNIRRNLSDHNQLLETLRDKWHETGNCKKNCPPGFDYLPEAGSCYRVILELKTWDAATERCRQMTPGTHLAAITSKDENDAVVRYLRSQLSGDNNTCRPINNPWPVMGNLIWIGGQTSNPLQCGNAFVWRPLRGIEIPFNYTNWYPKYPDCNDSVEHCVHYASGKNYTWNDFNCRLLSCAICELHV